MMNQNYNTNRDYKDVVILLITPILSRTLKTWRNCTCPIQCIYLSSTTIIAGKTWIQINFMNTFNHYYS